MAYESPEQLKRRIESLRQPFGSGSIASGLAQGLRARKANKLEKQLEQIEASNQANQASELGMLVSALKTGRTGNDFVSATPEQFKPSDPEVRSLLAKTLLERSTGGNRPAALQIYDAYSQMNPEQRAQFIEANRNPYLNMGDRYENPFSGETIARGVSPDNAPELRGQQVAAEEGARIEAIPQRVAAETGAERATQMPQAAARVATAERQADTVLNDIARAKDLASGWSTGWGSKLSGLPGTDAKDLSALVDTIKANIGFQQLQEMRSQSPTGAALGAVQVQELMYLQSVLGNLDQSQSKEQFLQNLQNVEEAISAIVNGTQQQFQDSYGGSAEQISPSIDDLVRKYQ